MKVTERYLAVAALCVVIFLTDIASGQDSDSIEAKIGTLELAVPSAFVTHWSATRPAGGRLDVAFSYPDAEPLGLLRFGRDVGKWTTYEQALLERGVRILSVELTTAPADRQGRLAVDPERERILENACKFVGGTNQKYTEFDVEFVRCVGKEGDLALRGHAPTYDVNFLSRSSGAWRLSRFDAKYGVWTRIEGIRQDHLHDWRSIVDRTTNLIASWKKK